MSANGLLQYGEPEFWDHLLLESPAAAMEAARSVLAMPGASREAAALAHATVCRCLYELGDLTAAQQQARVALQAVGPASTPVKAAVVLSVSVVLAESGYVDEALAALDAQALDATGPALGRIHMQAAYLLHHAGRLNDAIARLDLSERELERDGEPRDRLRLRLNRGLVLLQQGRLAAAEHEFEVAAELAREVGFKTSEAQCLANLGVLHGRARRLRLSMEFFDRAAAVFAEAGNPDRTVSIMQIDRAEVFMHSGLVRDAVEAAREAVRLVAPSGNRVVYGDALLVLARAEVAAGLGRAAARDTALAVQAFESAGRADMVPHARALGVLATLADERDAAARVAAIAPAATIADELRLAGWHRYADEISVARIRTAYDVDSVALVADELDALRSGTASLQRDVALAGWYVDAISRVQDAEHQTALDSCRAGLDLLDGIVAEAPTLEARSAAIRLGGDISQLTIDVAITLGDADTVLASAEGTRARALHDELDVSERHRPLTEDGAVEMRRELAARLGDTVLVEWVVSRGRVWAVVFARGVARLVDVAARRDAARARDRLVLWLDRANDDPDASSAGAARAAAALGELLVEPLELEPDVAVVTVPVDDLHLVPWSGLPGLTGRVVSLVPNAQLWLDADRRAGETVASVGIVVGPDVATGAAERSELLRCHPRAVLAEGSGATAATMRSMFAGLDLVHVAAHGRFRSDRPLLSTIHLDDGEVALDRAVPPRVRSRLVVLSSCEGGASGTADGSEVLGMSSVMLARGASAVLAPLTAVRDLECGEFVTDVHGRLAAGASLGEAVADARSKWLTDDDLSRWAVASSFAVFGSSHVTLAR